MFAAFSINIPITTIDKPKRTNLVKCNRCIYYKPPMENGELGKCSIFSNKETKELEYAVDARKYPEMCGPLGFYYDENIFDYGY